jgi:chemotaxis protein methyltransferase CheR
MLVSQANMADVDFYSFRKLIADRTGIYFSDRKRQMLMQAISEFTQQLQAKNSTDVIQMLNSLSTRSDPWRRLISRLTINETFFFRHFRGIEKQLLPKVILEKNEDKVLNIWSAGCSTGEEPYTIAMVLLSQINHIEDWKIRIYATDIDNQALVSARRAIYRDWSMRQIPKNYLKSYFTEKNGEYHLLPQVKKLVHFDYLNLKDGNFPDLAAGIAHFDIIFCRNVTIYFEAQDTIRIARKFFESLVTGGRLIVGHSEPSAFIYDQFRSDIADDIVVYHKDSDNPTLPKKIRQQIKPPDERRKGERRQTKSRETSKANMEMQRRKDAGDRRKSPNFFTLRNEALAYIESNHLEAAAKVLDKILVLQAADARMVYLSAYVEAKLGNLEKADLLCRKALATSPEMLQAQMLRAILAKESRNYTLAREMVQSIIYLQSDYLPAYLELLQMAVLEEKLSEVQRLGRRIKSIAKNLDSENRYEILEGMTVAQIVDYVAIVMGETK